MMQIVPGTYDIAQICRNGHVITSHLRASPAHGVPFCVKCGAATITACSKCSEPIRGHYSGAMFFPYDRPAFCHKCGHYYPWTESGLSAARGLAQLLEGLTDEERTELTISLDDLIRDSPRTPLVVARAKQLLGRAGKESARLLRDVLVEFVSESARKGMFG